MNEVMRVLEFDTAHRVMNHESKCRTLHGHRYRAEIYCSASDLDAIGRVVDFSVIKTKVGSWIDTYWDHTTILCKDDWLVESLQNDPMGYKTPWVAEFNPTAENMAKHLFDVSKELLADYPIEVRKIVIWETPNCKASYEPL